MGQGQLKWILQVQAMWQHSTSDQYWLSFHMWLKGIFKIYTTSTSLFIIKRHYLPNSTTILYCVLLDDHPPPMIIICLAPSLFPCSFDAFMVLKMLEVSVLFSILILWTIFADDRLEELSSLISSFEKQNIRVQPNLTAWRLWWNCLLFYFLSLYITNDQCGIIKQA